MIKKSIKYHDEPKPPVVLYAVRKHVRFSAELTRAAIQEAQKAGIVPGANVITKYGTKSVVVCYADSDKECNGYEDLGPEVVKVKTPHSETSFISYSYKELKLNEC